MIDLRTATIDSGTNKDKVINYLKEKYPDKVTIREVWKETQIKNRQQVYSILSELEQNLKVKKEDIKHTGYYTWIKDDTSVEEETEIEEDESEDLIEEDESEDSKEEDIEEELEIDELLDSQLEESQ